MNGQSGGTMIPPLDPFAQKFDTINVDATRSPSAAAIDRAMEIAAPRARILLSTNCTRLTRRELERIARFALKFRRQAADFHNEPELPDIPRDTGAQTLWLTLK